MPRFFYDFFDGETWSEDEVGLELASSEQAYLEAFAGARSMWPELIDGKRDPRACAFEIKGENGLELLRFDFTELLGDDGATQVQDVPHAAMIRALEETHVRAKVARADLRVSFEQTRQTLVEAKTLVAQLETFERHRDLR